MCLLAEVDDTYSQHIKSKMYLLGAMLHCYDTVHTESRHTRDEYSNHTDYAGYINHAVHIDPNSSPSQVLCICCLYSRGGGTSATDRKSTRLNSSHVRTSRMPSSA